MMIVGNKCMGNLLKVIHVPVCPTSALPHCNMLTICSIHFLATALYNNVNSNRFVL